MVETLVAVEQVGYGIFGIGETEDAAKQDALSWLDRDYKDDLAEVGWNSRPVDGETRVARITPALAAEVRAHGGSIAYGSLRDGTLCTLAEEAAEEDASA